MKINLKILLLFFIISVLPIIVFADEEVQLQVIDCPDYTDEYKKWLEIPDDEKSNYIEPQIFEDSKDIILRASKKSDSENLVGKSNLPSRFIKSYYGTVKDQGETNTCWAYSASSVFESNYFVTNNRKKEFSAMHMEYATSKDYNSKGFNRQIDQGGNFNIALAYATNGLGLATNSAVGNKSITPSLIKNIKATQKVSDYIELEGQEKLKNYIYNYGVVSAYTCIDANYFSSNMYDYNDNLAYYCDKEESVSANHAITIIGWDDNYQNASFPGIKGAYIVLNSYGSSFGNNGLYYIMYDDKFLSNSDTVFYGVTKTNDIDYDHIYQYDDYGWVSDITMNVPIYASNVFYKESNENEQLTEISFYLPVTQSVNIYINSKNDDKDITKATKSFTTEVLESGYHTVKLDKPIILNGDSFVVTLLYSEKIPIERKVDSSFSWCYTVTSNNGESFVSSNRNIIC